MLVVKHFSIGLNMILNSFLEFAITSFDLSMNTFNKIHSRGVHTYHLLAGGSHGYPHFGSMVCDIL